MAFTSSSAHIRLERRLDQETHTPSCWLLADCLDKAGRYQPSELNLDKVLGCQAGSFVWGGRRFSDSASNVTLTFATDHVGVPWQPTPVERHRTALSAKFKHVHDDGSKSYQDTSVELDDFITNVNGVLERTRSRTLVLCFDGTSNSFDETNTNIVHLLRRLLKNKPNEQMVYYQEGVGTYIPPGTTATRVGTAVAKVADKAFAMYLHEHVMGGYRFLTHTYQYGDKILIFGFSRGAHTARAVAGMLNRVGLLPSHNSEHIPFAYQLYDGTNSLLCDEFKKTFSTHVEVDFLGVWDTVASVGNLFPHSLQYTDENPCVKVFRQGLAMDERRVKFLPSIIGTVRDIVTKETENGQEVVKTTKVYTDCKEVWFRGNHCDVGGGNDLDTASVCAANIPLRWMLKECLEYVPDLLLVEESPIAAGQTNPSIERVPTVTIEATGRVTINPPDIASDKDMAAQTHKSLAWGTLQAFLYRPFASKDPKDRDSNSAPTKGPSAGEAVMDTLMTTIWWGIEYLPTFVQLGRGDDGRNLWQWVWHRGKGRELKYSAAPDPLSPGRRVVYLHESVREFVARGGDAAAGPKHAGGYVGIPGNTPFSSVTFEGQPLTPLNLEEFQRKDRSGSVLRIEFTD